jgi:hypothetical protein
MTLAFFLSMPNRGSWNGQWSGQNNKYVITRKFTTKAGKLKAEEIAKQGSYFYSWSDGWSALIKVEKVTSQEAAKLRKTSDGFCGYNWMIDSIIANNCIKA